MEQSKESETSRPTAFATMIAILSVVVLIVLIFVGSRGLRDFDSALIGYAVATVFAVAALAFRYTLWIGRPPTWRYFRAGWTNFLSLRNFRRYSFLIPKAWWTDIFAQTFIRKRGTLRWVAHMCIFWGVILSLLITLPLTFGWLHFTLIPPYHYRVWFFGLPLFILYHGLDFTAALLIIGVTIALWRRISDAGLLAIQRFGFDLVPLVPLTHARGDRSGVAALDSLWQVLPHYRAASEYRGHAIPDSEPGCGTLWEEAADGTLQALWTGIAIRAVCTGFERGPQRPWSELRAW
jgi:hypothetical protein